MALNEIQKRIQSTEKTAKITNAMQMVSRNKVNHLLDMAQSYQVYIDHLRHTMSQLYYTLKVTPPDFTKPDIRSLIRNRPVKKIGIFLVTTDKGLAGPYNTSLLQGMDDWIRQQDLADKELIFYTLGRTGERYCDQRGYQIARKYYPLSDQPSFREAHYFIRQLRSAYVEKEVDILYLAYQHYARGSLYQFGVDKLLPVVNVSASTDPEYVQGDRQAIPPVYLIEPTAEEVLEGLLPQYIEANVYGALLQAKTAEHFARMTAMKSATDNAHDLIDQLKLKYNQERQVKVTNEILEIVAGAQAQQKERRK